MRLYQQKLSLIFLVASLFLIFRAQIYFLQVIAFLESDSARVVNQYKKDKKFVLKLSNFFEFYTISYLPLKDILNEKIEFKKINSGFKRFYITYNLKLIPTDYPNYFLEKTHKELKNLFKALFLGESIEYSLRKKISALGISHLFALSGFHLGVLSFVLYLILSPIYSFFHNFYPYRNRYIDLGIVILIFEFIYLHFTNYPPSLIRAFILEMVLFLVLFSLKEINSFKVLVIVVFVSLYIFVDKVFSIGYLLSIAGVFYIYLFFKYIKPTFFTSIFLSFYLYLMMFFYSHYFFGEFNYFQLLSPIVNLAFVVFYPIEIFLHLINKGDLLDPMILSYLNLGENYWYVKVDKEILGLIIFLSILAIFKKRFFVLLNLVSLFIFLKLVI